MKGTGGVKKKTIEAVLFNTVSPLQGLPVPKRGGMKLTT